MKIIICEGKTEVALLYALNEKISNTYTNYKPNNIKQSITMINEDIGLINLEGKANLNGVVKNLGRTLIDKLDIEKISFIMDADDNFDAMKDSLNDRIESLKKSVPEAEYNYFILPQNDGSLGMAEDLIMDGLYKKELINVIKEEVYPKLCEYETIKNPSKTKLMIFNATQDPQSSNASFMIENAKKLINLEDEVFENLKKFISDIVD